MGRSNPKVSKEKTEMVYDRVRSCNFYIFEDKVPNDMVSFGYFWRLGSFI